YGWLGSLDGTKPGRVLFRCGKAHGGYFTNLNIQNHAIVAMGISDRYNGNEDHVFVFDNATNHLKHAENALSTRKMSNRIPKNGENWGVEVNQVSVDWKVMFCADGKVCKVKMPMYNGRFNDATAQPLYFPPGN
ncbi:hypothetical protein PAXRUDRAFT_155173, partial [Paxillus rubicundulus Ve08.2h10]